MEEIILNNHLTLLSVGSFKLFGSIASIFSFLFVLYAVYSLIRLSRKKFSYYLPYFILSGIVMVLYLLNLFFMYNTFSAWFNFLMWVFNFCFWWKLYQKQKMNVTVYKYLFKNEQV